MKNYRKTTYIFIAFILVFSCKNRSDNSSYNDNKESTANQTNSCDFEDGNHEATVDYYNPDTGHQATYDLSVEVEDCEVTQINFNNGGWLDGSHIDPTELESDGTCTLEDDRGREFTIQIND